MKQIYLDLIALRDEYLYKVRFNGQVMYLERILNDKFDPISRRIYIDDGPVQAYFIYRVAENKQPQYLYRRWTSVTTYANHEFCVYGNKVYRALGANFNHNPPANPSTWQYVKDIDFIWHKSEFATQYNFVVYAPAVVIGDEPAIKALINYYKLGGRTYIIKYF